MPTTKHDLKSRCDFFSPGARVFFSGRSVDFTWPPGRDDFSSRQKDYLRKLLGDGHPPVVQVRQVHGDHILVLKNGDARTADGPVEGDGLVTDRCDVVLAVRTADCLPVFIHDPRLRVIGLVHAGWRGTAAGIVTKALEIMRAVWGCRPQDLQIAFGPAIRACCYQVGEDFCGLFPAAVEKRPSGFYLDLVKFNRGLCLAAGIPERRIHDDGICTCCHPEYFSYRREGEKAGRHLSLFFLEGGEKAH